MTGEGGRRRGGSWGKDLRQIRVTHLRGKRRRRRQLFDLLLEKLVEELGSAARSESLPPCLSLVRNDSLTNVGRDLAPSSIGRSTPIHQILSIHGHMETSSQETHLSFRVILRKQQEIIRKTRSNPFYTHLCAQIDGGLCMCAYGERKKLSDPPDTSSSMPGG